MLKLTVTLPNGEKDEYFGTHMYDFGTINADEKLVNMLMDYGIWMNDDGIEYWVQRIGCDTCANCYPETYCDENAEVYDNCTAEPYCAVKREFIIDDAEHWCEEYMSYDEADAARKKRNETNK